MAGRAEALDGDRRRDRGTGKKLRSRPDEIFLYRLALELNIPFPEKLKKRITVRQVKKWMAFWRVEPFGDAWRMAARAALTTAAGMGAKPDPEAEERFLPSYRERPQTEDDIRREMMKIPGFREQMTKGE